MKAFLKLIKNPKVDVKDNDRIYTDISSQKDVEKSDISESH